MRTAQSDAKMSELLEKALNMRFCMFVTISRTSELSGRPMTTLDASDGKVYFLTSQTSDVSQNASAPSGVLLTYSDRSTGRYITLQGTANLSTDQTLVDKLWTPIAGAFFERGSQDPRICVLAVQVETAELWEPTGNKFEQFLSIAKAAMGRDVQPNELGRHAIATDSSEH
jgi:general stress protein 26